MTKINTLDAFQNKSETAVPLGVWHHFTPNEHVEATSENQMLQTDRVKEQAYLQSLQPDFIKLMNDGLFTYPFNNVADPTDLKSLAQIQPISTDHPWLTDQFNLISDQLKTIDKATLVFNNVFSAVTLFKWALVVNAPEQDLSVADHLFADLYTENPKIVIHALETINQDIKKQIQVEAKAGLDGVLFSTQEIQDSRIDYDFFEQVQKRLDHELIEEINQNFKTSILHICGFAGATNHLPWFVDYDLPVINWATGVDGYSLGEGKKLFDGKVVFGGLGNTTDDTLFKGNQSAIEAEVDRILDEAGVKGVIIGADCTIPRETPTEHIRWAAEAAHSYLARKS